MEIKVKILVRQVRKRKGLTISELSRLSGISQSYISDIERNHSYPTIYGLCALAEALEVSPEELYRYVVKKDSI